MRITFEEQGHVYTVNGDIATISVTELLGKHGLAPDYSGVDKAKLRDAASKGKAVHKDLENIFNEKDYTPVTEQGRQFAMLRVYKGQAEFLPDLGERGNKVQFETDCTAAYALVYRDPIPGVTDAAVLAQQQALAGQQALAQQQALAAQQAALAGQQTQTITLTNEQIVLLQQILAAAQANQH